MPAGGERLAVDRLEEPPADEGVHLQAAVTAPREDEKCGESESHREFPGCHAEVPRGPRGQSGMGW